MTTTLQWTYQSHCKKSIDQDHKLINCFFEPQRVRFGAGGEANSPNPASGSQGATIRPLNRFSFGKLAAFNRRTVDLWGVGER